MPGQLIAANKKELGRFLLDLCGFSLDEAGMPAGAYAFHLHLAFRHQLIVQEKRWATLCEKIKHKPLRRDEQDKDIWAEINDLAQSIVSEVQQSNKEPWAIRLLKTQYLSHLDQARQTNEQAIKLLAASPEQLLKSGSLTASSIVITDPTTQLYVDSLTAYNNYLDALFLLPFSLEKLLAAVANNKGITYQPQKTTEMLVALLGTLNKAVNPNGDLTQDLLMGAIKIAIQASMPDLPIDTQLSNTIRQDVLPVVEKLITTGQTLEKAKQQLFGDAKSARARTLLLASLGVQFDSLETIFENTLINPIEQCSKYLNQFEHSSRLEELRMVFASLDKATNLADEFNLSLLPFWLRKTNDYYQQLNTRLTQANDAFSAVGYGLGFFYDHLVSLIPTTVVRYFSCASDYQKLLGYDIDVEKIMAYLSFHQLVEQGQINEPLKQRFFTAYMKEVGKASPNHQFDYRDYSDLTADLSQVSTINPFAPLANQIQAFERRDWHKHPDLPKGLQNLKPQQYALLAMIYRLKELESQLDNADANFPFNQILSEINKALITQETDQQMTDFKQLFLQPVAKRVLLVSMQKQWIIKLEQAIDGHDPTLNMAYHNNLQPIYSKLKEGTRLAVDDYRVLEDAFVNEDSVTAGLETARTLEAQLHSTKDTVRIAVVLTDQQTLISQLKNKAFPGLAAILVSILSNLDSQLNDCKQLLGLSKPGTNLYKLCSAKIKYIEVIKKHLNSLKNELDQAPDSLAKKMVELLSQSHVSKVVDTISFQSLGSQIIRFAWYVLPSNNGYVNDTFLNNVFAYYLKEGNPLHEIYREQQQFNQSLNKTAVIELMPILSDPLSITNLLPKEKILDAVINKLLGIEEGKQLFSSGTHFLKKTAKALTAKLDEKSLSKMFPYQFMGTLAYQVLRSETMQTVLSSLLSSLANEYQHVLVENTEEIVRIAKNRLYPLLGVELQRVVEQQALDYVNHPNQRQASKTERDAFAMYYLKYHAIKQRNPQVTAEQCIRLLFKTLDEAAVSQLVTAFKDMDKVIAQEGIQSFNNSEAINQQLKFLIDEVDFNNPDMADLIRMTLINSLLLMCFNSASSLDSDHQKAVEQSTIDALESIQKKYTQPPDPVHEQDEGVVKAKSTTLTPAVLIQELHPAQKQAAKIYLTHLQSKLKTMQSHVDTEVAKRSALLEDDQVLPLFGRTWAAVSYDRIKENPYRRLLLAAQFIYETVTVLGTLVPLFLTCFNGGNVALQLFLNVIGIAGVVGASASVFGIALAAAVILTRLTIKFMLEIWRHRKEFNDVGTNPNHSGWRKAGLISLIVLKCLGLAVVKTLFIDWFFDRATKLLGIKPLSFIANGLRSYPEKDKVLAENQALDNLHKQLQAMQELVDNQLKSPNIIQAKLFDSAKNLAQAMQQVADMLANITLMDVRKTPKYMQNIQTYNTLRMQIIALFNSLEVIKQIQDVDAPIVLASAAKQDSASQLSIKDFTLLKDSPILVNLEHYIAKAFTDNKQQALPQASYSSQLISHFFAWFRREQSQIKPLVEEGSSSRMLTSSIFEIAPSLPDDLDQEIDDFMQSMIVINQPEPLPADLKAAIANHRDSFWRSTATDAQTSQPEISYNL